jgi:hypothetical protein
MKLPGLCVVFTRARENFTRDGGGVQIINEILKVSEGIYIWHRYCLVIIRNRIDRTETSVRVFHCHPEIKLKHKPFTYEE